MKKNGFIATSILYSFFLVFITLFIALIMNYLHNQVLISAVDEAAWDMLLSINNTKISDLELGDHIKFQNKVGYNCETPTNKVCYMNEDATWVVARIVTNGSYKMYYFLSDLNAQVLNVNHKLSTDSAARIHPMSIDVFNEIRGTYTSTLNYPGITVSLPTTSVLKSVRSSNLDDNIKAAILAPGGSYVAYVDDVNTGYQRGAFYEVRTYNFNLKEQALPIIKNYCGGNFDGTNVNYNSNNPFGYIHTTTGVTIGNATDGSNTEQDYVISNSQKYVDYCLYASPVQYTHSKNDFVVDYDEVRDSDRIIDTYSSKYHIRLMATVMVNSTSESTYIAGGKGTAMDPYLLTNGVKQS